MVRKWLPFLILLIFPLVVYWPLSLNNYWVKWDNPDYFFPVRHFISDCFHQGIMPSWNPYEYLGLPMHADPQTGFWYPITWIIVIFKGYDIAGSNIDYLTHIVIAGMGMFMLLRGRGITVYTACLLAICYQGCGFFVGNMECLNWIVSAAWLPWVLYCLFGLLDQPGIKPALSLALTMSMMLTGGYPAFFLLLIYLLLVIGIMKLVLLMKRKEWPQLRNTMTWASISSIVFVVLSSGYLFSMKQAMGWFSRSDGVDLAHVVTFPFSPRATMSLLVPFSVVNNSEYFSTDMSMANGYLGLVPLLFALVGLFVARQWQLRILVVFGLFCLIASFGGYTPLRAFLFHYIPGMKLFRFSSIFRLYFMVAMFPIAACAMDAFIIESKYRKAIMVSFAAVLASVIILMVWAIALGGEWLVPPVLEMPKMFRFVQDVSMHSHIVFHGVVQLVLLALLAAILFLLKNPKIKKVAIAITVVFDIAFTIQLNAACTILTDCTVKTSNLAMLAQPNDFPIPTGNIGDWSTNVIRVPPAWMNQGLYSHRVSAAAYNPFMLTLFDEMRKKAMLPVVESKPLVYIQGDNSATAIITAFQPNAITVETNTPKEGLLVFQQSIYIDWKCLVDNMPARIQIANKGEMGVELPIGKHVVSFKYNPPYLVLLLIVSFGGILVTMAILIFGKRPPSTL